MTILHKNAGRGAWQARAKSAGSPIIIIMANEVVVVGTYGSGATSSYYHHCYHSFVFCCNDSGRYYSVLHLMCTVWRATCMS